jgi:amidase
MSVFSLKPRDGNPVTVDVLDDICKKLGVTIKDDEREDYHKLLAVFHESAEELMDMVDDEPGTDLERFPRKNIHFPDRSKNEYGAWAWKCSIKDENENYSGRLYGKTVAMKDNIGIKDVPMLLGSNFIKNYTPVC